MVFQMYQMELPVNIHAKGLIHNNLDSYKSTKSDLKSSLQ